MNELLGIIFISLDWRLVMAMILVSVGLWISLFKSHQRLIHASQFHRISVRTLNLIATLALFGFILRPSVQSEDGLRVGLNTSSEKITLADTPDYWLQPNLNKRFGTEAFEITDPHQILIQHPEVKQLEVYGDGLTQSQWRGFNNIKIHYQIPELKTGLINTQWNKQLKLGETLLISGELQLPQNTELTNNKFTLKLLDPAGDKVDEIEIRSAQIFSLQAQPKLAGNLKYTIEVSEAGSIDSFKPVIQQSIHTTVNSVSQARILVIQSAASFETKQLQNWAAESGAKILVKTKISRDKYIHRSTNFPELTRFKFSAELLKNFDLVVLDGRGFVELSSIQLQWLTEAVSKGLGVLILADESLLNNYKQAKLLSGVSLNILDEVKSSKLSWLDNNNRWTAATEFVSNALAATITLDQKLLSNPKKLLVTSSGSTIAYQYNFQLGRVAINLFNQSHQWVTLGEAGSHSEYWQSLISSIATSNPLKISIDIDNKLLNFSHKLTPICVVTKTPLKKVSVKKKGKSSLKHELLMQTSVFDKNKYCGYFWPEQSAWYQLQTDQFKAWFFVEDSSNWPALLQLEKVKATLKKQRAYGYDSPMIGFYRPISLWIYWWCWMTAATLLWIERKFITD